MSKDINWQALKEEYITGKLTFTALAEKYHMSYSVLVRRAAMDRWREKREDFRNDTLQQQRYSVEKIADRLNRKLCQWVDDPNSINISDIDKAAGVLKKLQDMKHSEEETPTVYLSHQIPRK